MAVKDKGAQLDALVRQGIEGMEAKESAARGAAMTEFDAILELATLDVVPGLRVPPQYGDVRAWQPDSPDRALRLLLDWCREQDWDVRFTGRIHEVGVEVPSNVYHPLGHIYFSASLPEAVLAAVRGDA